MSLPTHRSDQRVWFRSYTRRTPAPSRSHPWSEDNSHTYWRCLRRRLPMWHRSSSRLQASGTYLLTSLIALFTKSHVAYTVGTKHVSNTASFSALEVFASNAQGISSPRCRQHEERPFSRMWRRQGDVVDGVFPRRSNTVCEPAPHSPVNPGCRPPDGPRRPGLTP